MAKPATPLGHRLGQLAAWIVTRPARRLFFDRRDVREVEFPSEDGLTLRGWLADVDGARGTVVLGHGYRDDRRQLYALVPALAALSLRALLIDFRAHGRSAGTRITIGAEESRDVRASLAWAAQLGGPVSYLGFSMGAAAYLLSGREAQCAVIDSPYDTLDEAIAVRGRFMRAPSRLVDAFRQAKEQRTAISIEQVRPIERVRGLSHPTLFVFARGDEWIGESVRARYLHELSPSCELVEVDGRHNGHFDAGWLVRVARFFEKNAS